MTPRLTVAIADAEIEADGSTAVDIFFGLTATLEISQASHVWRSKYFPVLELAIELRRSSYAVPFAFASMSMEEEPVLTGELQAGDAMLVTYDGERFVVTPADSLGAALRQFVTDVDDTLHRMCGRNIADIERSLR